MKRVSLSIAMLLALAFMLTACAERSATGAGWVTLVDGTTGLDNWHRIGDANWRGEDGAIVADRGKGGYLVSKNPYKDFEIRAEFWAATDTKGPQLTVKLNGVQTASIQDGKHASGPFALQYGAGVQGAQGGPIKWRKVQIRPL